MRRFIALLLIVILIFQTIPLDKLSWLGFNSQLVEEIQHSGCHSLDCMVKKGNFFFKLSFDCIEYEAINKEITEKSELAIHLTEKIPVMFIPEVPSPPPNC